MGSFERPIKESLDDLVNVQDFGAKGAGGWSGAVTPARWVPPDYGDQDYDTDAFLAAIDYCSKNGKSGLYVPDGVYKITKPLSFVRLRLHGNGNSTVLIAAGGYWADHKNDSLIFMGGNAQLENITLQYDFDIADIASPSDTQRGQYALVKCYAVDGKIISLQRGASIRNVQTNYCWTAFSDWKSDVYQDTIDTSPFSITFDTLEISNIAHAGFDFASIARTGNVYSNIYIANNGLEEKIDPEDYIYRPKTGFLLEGEESESVINQLNVEHTTFSDASISLTGCRGLSIGTIHIEGIDNSTVGGAYIKWSGSAGVIDALTVYNTRMSVADTNIINFYSPQFKKANELFNPNTANKCVINNLVLLNISQPFCRGSGALYPYYSNSNYGWYKSANSYALWRGDQYNQNELLYVDVKQYTWNALSNLPAEWIPPAGDITFDAALERNKYLARPTKSVNSFIVSWDNQSNDETISNNQFSTLFMTPLPVTGPATAPTFTSIPTPTPGQIAYSQTNKLYVWIGSKWKAL